MNRSTPSVLVIGGAGYIGSHIVLELCDQGYSVTVFDNLSTGCKENIDSRAEFIRGDILINDDLHNLFKRTQTFDAIFHFAALKAAGESMIKPEKYAVTNIIGTINILNHMMGCGINNIIFSSSAAVYGIPKYVPVDEDHPMSPINFYGFTKLEIENILFWYSKLRGINFASLRYFNAAGYDIHGRIRGLEKNPANLLPIIMETAMGIKKSMNVFGNDYNTYDGTGIRDYIHVTDLATAHIFSLKYIQNKNENLILNLATGKGYSVLDVIKAAEKITGNKIAIKMTNRREGDPEELVAVSKRAREKINWCSKHSDIETILQSMWNVYNKN